MVYRFFPFLLSHDFYYRRWTQSFVSSFFVIWRFRGRMLKMLHLVTWNYTFELKFASDFVKRHTKPIFICVHLQKKLKRRILPIPSFPWIICVLSLLDFSIFYFLSKMTNKTWKWNFGWPFGLSWEVYAWVNISTRYRSLSFC